MKRDLDLAREIVLKLEADDTGSPISHITIDGYSKKEINYHIYLLQREGFIEASIEDDNGNYENLFYAIYNLEWKGHDFADASRSSGTWAKAKELIKEKGAALTFDIALIASKAYFTAQTGIQT
ncbi:MAG: DUF2513 domain-containing protein [Methanospirillum sp.]|nr:DUF2513 domain-containing protein [Methanospirillum sp.]